nr:MAG: Protein of unknown function (DUF1642) [Bacteriophage sp.]
MDRNEAVQKLAKAARISVAYAEDLYDSFFEKPVVPQCVAKWYEGNKLNLDLNLCSLVFDLGMNSMECYREEFKAWVNGNKKTFITTLVNMHQFGYEVEKETKYRVKMEAARYNGFPQFLCEEDRGIFWGSVFDCRKTKFTRKELEQANFGWVFTCDGIEIKEVE